MTEIIAALEATVRDACARHSDIEAVTACAGGGWNPRLWAVLEGIGVTTLSVREEYGGAGGDVAAAVAVLEVLGEHAAGVPLAESALLAGWLLAESGVDVASGPMTAALAGPDLRAEPQAAGLSVHGTIRDVPWARWADQVVVLAGEQVLQLLPGDLRLTEGTNLAGEPRDDVHVATTLPATRVHHLPGVAGDAGQAFRDRAALARAALLVGAGRRALDLAVADAGEREQFGRPIARFQAVQQHLAAMAGEVLLAKVATEAAALAFDAGGDVHLAVPAAKIVADQMAGVVSALAHQVHGAIGYTDEHPLHHSTTRLWAWRDEADNEQVWSARVGERAVANRPGGLWPLLCGSA